MAERAVDQGQGPSIMVHGVGLRADVPSFHAGSPLGVMRVYSHTCRQCHIPRHTSALRPVLLQYMVVQYSIGTYLVY